LFGAVLLTLALCGKALASNAAHPMRATLTWQAKVGGERLAVMRR
jgi:hypothetical protein